MKYKTLCRLLIKLMGIYFLIEGFAVEWRIIMGTISLQLEGRVPEFKSVLWSLLPPLGTILPGIYLFAGARWLLDKMIPSNRPYCHECGYDLTGNGVGVCAECGTPFKPTVIDPEPHH